MSLKVIRIALVSTAALAIGGSVAWSQAGAPTAEMKVMQSGEIKWMDAPPSLPKGAKLAVLYGDPAKPGLFVLRAKMPANYKIAAHWHPTDENISVIAGSVFIGHGDKLDMAQGKSVGTNGFFSMPAKMHHFFYTKKEATIEVVAMGPFETNYLNPDDDPRKMAATK
jgi:hypothetical protein